MEILFSVLFCIALVENIPILKKALPSLFVSENQTLEVDIAVSEYFTDSSQSVLPSYIHLTVHGPDWINSELIDEVSGSLPMGSQVRRVFVADGYAYVSNYLDGFKVVNVSDITDPEEVGSIEFGDDEIMHSRVRGDHAFLAGNNYFRILDVSDKTDPELVGSYPVSGLSTSLDLQDEYVYYMKYSTGPTYIFEITDVSDPQFITTFDGGGYWISVQGDFAYTTKAGSVETSVVNISDTTNPKTMDTITSMGGKNVLCDSTGRDFYYIADPNVGISSINVTNKSDIFVSFTLDVDETMGCLDLFQQGNFLFVASNTNGVVVVDVSDPSNMSVIEQYNSDLSETCGVYIVGNQLFCTECYTSLNMMEIGARRVTMDNGGNNCNNDEPEEVVVTIEALDSVSGEFSFFPMYVKRASCNGSSSDPSSWQCNGKMFNESGVCSGYGSCDFGGNCSCIDGYEGVDCENPLCFGISSTPGHPTPVCSGHGICVGKDDCICLNGTSGDDCSEFSCFGLHRDEPFVCSGHGNCVEYDNCTCWSEEFTGKECQYWNCFSVPTNEVDDVCGGHGVCVTHDTCLCFSGYEKANNDTNPYGECTRWKCGGVYKDDTQNVCSGRGTCLGLDDCDCSSSGSYYGEDCEKWGCAGLDMDQYGVVCGGHGTCVSPNQCSCSSSYSGKECTTNLLYYTVLTPVLSLFCLTLILFSAFICCVLCLCVCLGIFILVLLSMVCCGVQCGVVIKQFEGLKRYGKLDNFDLLLREQELDKDASFAHLRIKPGLFEVNMEDIQTISVIGEGGSSSVVFKATWKGQICAFKCFKTRFLCSSQDRFNEFEREVEILASINHMNIIQFFGATLNPPRVGIIMEFCNKGEILEFVVSFRNQYLSVYPLGEKMRLIRGICSALEYLHERNIIHRDLKCENVLVSEHHVSKLMDFGLSKCVDRMSEAKSTRIGTSIYMSPEICLSEDYDEKCDVFSLAIMIFVLFTENDTPYKGEEIHNIELRVANSPDFRPDINDLDEVFNPEDDDINQWMKNLIQKCWDHESEKRYSCREIREIIEEKLLGKSDYLMVEDKNNKMKDLHKHVKWSNKTKEDGGEEGGKVENITNMRVGDKEEECIFRRKIEELEEVVRNLQEENKDLKEENSRLLEKTRQESMNTL